jgi:hypothetical protein
LIYRNNASFVERDTNLRLQRPLFFYTVPAVFTRGPLARPKSTLPSSGLKENYGRQKIRSKRR